MNTDEHRLMHARIEDIGTTKARRHEVVSNFPAPLRAFVTSWFICLSVFTAIARADEQWILTTADFKSETVAVRSIDDAGVHLSDDRTIAMNSFLQLDRAARAKSSP